MLIQWLVSIALSSELILVSMQGFILLAKIHQAQVGLVRELNEVRFLAGYFKAVMHEATEISINPQQSELMAVHHRASEQDKSEAKVWRFFLSDTINSRGQQLMVQEQDHRREVLATDLKSFSLRFCVAADSKLQCKSSFDIQDWGEVKAVEFTIEIVCNRLINRVISMKNNHRWQFVLRKGKSIS